LKKTEIQIGMRVQLNRNNVTFKNGKVNPIKIGTICGEPINGNSRNGNPYIPCQLDNGTIENWLISQIKKI
jgi:hypothetical protein